MERLLSVSELSDAGFPVDVGGNQFDKFRSLKQSDGSLLGVVVPKVNQSCGIYAADAKSLALHTLGKLEASS